MSSTRSDWTLDETNQAGNTAREAPYSLFADFFFVKLLPRSYMYFALLLL